MGIQLDLFGSDDDSPLARALAAQRSVLSLDADDLTAVLFAYLESRAILREGVSPGKLALGTRTLYAGRVKAFALWLRATSRRIDRLTNEDMHVYGAALLRRYSHGYARLSLQVARLCLRALNASGCNIPVPELPVMIRRRPAHEARTPPPWQSIRAAYSKLLRWSLCGENPSDLRLALAVSLLAHSGLRRSEALGARWADLDIRPGWLLVHGKGDRDRFVPLSPAAIAVLQAQARLRPDIGPEWPLLGCTSQPGRPLGRVRLWVLMRDWLVDSGLPPEASCHILRRACATEMVRQGSAISTVRAILGHTSASQTLAYVSDPPAEDRAAAVAALGGIS